MRRPRDELTNAFYRDGSITLVARRAGEIVVQYPDAFFTTVDDADKLPASWAGGVSPDFPGYCRVTWPDKVEGYKRKDRLEHYRENLFVPRGIAALEADVDPVQRYLIEHHRVQFARDWRKLWFDLETENIVDWDRPWKQRILSFSWRSSSGAHGHVRAEARTDAAEVELLRTFIKIADRHDILLAWNGKRFDFRVVRGRCRELRVDFDSDLYHWLDHLKLFERYYLRSEDGAVRSSMALDAVGKKFLGQGKVPVQEQAVALGWDQKSPLFTWLWAHAPALMREYNDFDTELMSLLEDKTKFIDLHLALCRICRVLPGSRSVFPSFLIDGKMFQRGREKLYRFPSRINRKGAKRAKGAFVPKADVGLHESVAVLDYSKMYPSIIRTFNLSPETLDPQGELRVPESTIKGEPTGNLVARFKAAPEGHIPAALGDVLQARKKYSQMQAKAEVGSDAFHDAGRLSTACKALANSFYGVILSPDSRYYKQEIGESVTSVGRYLLWHTIKEVNRRGHKLVFGDTDSVAFVADDDEAATIKDAMNDEVIPAILREAGAPRGEIEIDYEKRYSKLLVTASKKYVGRFAVYKGRPAGPDAPMDIRGMEIVRSEVCEAARNLQRRILDLLLDGEQPAALKLVVSEARHSLLKGTTHEDLVLAKRITKPVKDYGTKPVHVRVAEWMLEEGMEVQEGQKIPFLMLTTGPVHPSALGLQDTVDRATYWNDQVYPPSLRALQSAFPRVEWNSLKVPKPRRVREGQGEMFRDELNNPPPDRPRVARIRKTRRTTQPGLVVLTFEGDDLGDAEIKRLRRLIEAHPGPNALEIKVRGDGRIWTMEVPSTVRDPGIDPGLSRALRELGIQWQKERPRVIG